MNKYIYYILYSLMLQSAIIYTVFILARDPKGIGFFIYTFGYACLCSLISIILLFKKNSTKWFIYYFAMVGNCIFLYYLIGILKGHTRLQFDFLDCAMILGCLLTIPMIIKININRFYLKAKL
jgi:hypothetical protein